METTYKGIDYAGHTLVNRNPKTGIRYGVIPQNYVGQAWYDSAEPDYGNACPYCGNEPKSGNNIHDMNRCPTCYHALVENDFMDEEVQVWFVDDGEYKAHCGEDGDIFILKSPYFTYAQFCSPCAPGACYLRNPLEEKDENNRAYCFGKDWFEDNKAPYLVYSVKTGEFVN